MHGSALPIETNPCLVLPRLAEKLSGRDLPSARVGRAYQAFVTHGTPVGEAVDWLEMAGESELAVIVAFPLHGESVGMSRGDIHGERGSRA
jgi:hypothetical protein